MKLIGYRYKNHADEEWDYTYDLDSVSHGKGIKEYGYVDPIYIDDEKNHVQVEIPKVNKAVDMMLSFFQTRNYDEFKNSVYQLIEAPEYKKQLKPWLDDGGYKKVDLAIALGVWEIEN